MMVAHVISSLRPGGAEWVAIRLAAAQRALDVDARLIALRGGALEASCHALGVPVSILEGRPAVLAARAVRHLAAEPFDVINSHNPPAHRFARLGRISPRRVLVMTLHGEASRSYDRLVGAPVTDGLVAVSSRVRDAFMEKHPDFPSGRLAVIENGVELPRLSDSPARGADAGRDVVLFVAARLDPIKNLDVLLRAMVGLRADLGVRLVIAGDGPDRARLERLSIELGVEKAVAFLGFRRDIDELTRAADIFVLPSKSEGMSLAILEAMAVGLPVVATAVGGTPEVVEDGVTGLLVPAGDPVALGTALRTLITHPDRRRRLGSAGRDRVADRFSLERTTRRYLRLYEAIGAAGGMARWRGTINLQTVSED